MKNYGHTWQWGESPEYTIDVCTHWDYWALPLSFSWRSFCILRDAVISEIKCYNFSIDFLCFHFGIEIWRWKK